MLREGPLVTKWPFVEQKKILAPVETFQIDSPKKPLNLDTFFKDRPGLWVEKLFRNTVSDFLKTVRPAETLTLSSYRLVDNTSYGRIKTELPENYEVGKFLFAIAKMIEAQKGGTEGRLQINGCANLFYLSDFVVSVYWDNTNREWLVREWSQDYIWSVDYRVFSCN